MVEHVFNPITWDAEARESLSLEVSLIYPESSRPAKVNTRSYN